MKRTRRDIYYLVIIVILIALCGQLWYIAYRKSHGEISVYYNQGIEANRKVADVIRNADKFVYFAVYTFTRNDLKDALLGAKHRGLDVRGITDREQEARTELQAKIMKELREAGITVLTQDHSAIMHLKTVVTDKAYASGSYNWTSSATNLNDEVLEIGTNEAVRKQYEKVLREIFEKYGH